jgi:hypothetical protein
MAAAGGASFGNNTSTAADASFGSGTAAAGLASDCRGSDPAWSAQIQRVVAVGVDGLRGLVDGLAGLIDGFLFLFYFLIY